MVRWSKTRRKFMLICFLIFGLAAASNFGTLRFLSSWDWTRHSGEVKDSLHLLSSSYLTAQANVRGFHLSGLDHYLALYQPSVAAIPLYLDRLEKLTVDNQQQQQGVRELRRTLEARIARWEKYIAIRKTKGLGPITEALREEEGRNLDAEVRRQVDALATAEGTLLEERINRLEGYAEITMAVISLLALLAIALMGYTSYLLTRDARIRAEAEEERDRFFSLSLDLLCISGMDGYFKRLSPAFSDVLGYSLQELYKIPILDLVHPEDRELTVREIERQGQGEKVLSFENRFRAKDGSFRLLSWKSVPSKGLMFAVARDVTQQKQFELSLISAQRDAEQGTRAKAEFLANMSHEIRTPLNGIIGMADLLAETPLSEDQRKFSSVIRSSGMALLKIINEILDFSKIEAGKLKVEKLEFSLRETLEAQLQLVTPEAGRKGLRMESRVDARIPVRLWGDSGRLGQVVLNLLGNAVKFTERGGVELHASLLKEEGGTALVKVCVSDTGIGMSPGQCSELFRPFTQVDGSIARKYGGTGLGLSICKQLVELMGGEIGVESAAESGSTFWFTIPFPLRG